MKFSVNDFNGPDGLQTWLAAKGIDTTGWGKNGTKEITHLWDELNDGEVIIQDTPLLRLVDVVQITIRRGAYLLVEGEQEFGDGQRRWRNLLPSEKMRPGENYLDAARRCLEEELGVNRRDITLVAATYTHEQSVADSPSYPGLRTQYTFHTIEAIVRGLPESDFWRENSAHRHHQPGGGDPVRKHHWLWRAINN